MNSIEVAKRAFPPGAIAAFEKMPAHRETFAQLLRKAAGLLEIQGGNQRRVAACQRAAEELEAFGGDLEAVACGEEKLPGVGSSTVKKLREWLATGRAEFLEKLRSEFPESLLEVRRVRGVGPAKARLLYERAGVASLQGLKRACESGKAAEIRGCGGEFSKRTLREIGFLEGTAGKLLLDQAEEAGREVARWLTGRPEIERLEVAGVGRRWEETVEQLHFLAILRGGGERLPEALRRTPWGNSVRRAGSGRALRFEGPFGVPVVLSLTPASEFAVKLLEKTGAPEHVSQLRALAGDGGIPVFQGDARKSFRREEEVYRRLGLSWIPPELREGRGEIEAASRREAPKLVNREDIRGTFHCHTRASDGRNSLEEMAGAARRMGLEYLGIADHSATSVWAGGLSAKRLLEQVAEIRRLNAEFEDFQLLSGVECDILRDGSLDYPDEILAELDYVVASVHQPFDLSEARQTGRVIRAIRNPFVTILGHPSGRRLLARRAYPIDLQEICVAAAASGTVIELNANPERLDMSWRLWRSGAAGSVLCAINPDAHNTDSVGRLRFGVRMARKGGLTARRVINTAPLGRILPWLATPKAERTAPPA